MPNFYKKIYNIPSFFFNHIVRPLKKHLHIIYFLCENLGIDADVLEFDTQLFGDGEIGLDSIDSLEIIAYVDDEFGVQMTGVGKEHFYSIETIAKYIRN